MQGSNRGERSLAQIGSHVPPVSASVTAKTRSRSAPSVAASCPSPFARKAGSSSTGRRSAQLTCSGLYAATWEGFGGRTKPTADAQFRAPAYLKRARSQASRQRLRGAPGLETLACENGSPRGHCQDHDEGRSSRRSRHGLSHPGRSSEPMAGSLFETLPKSV